MNVKLSFLIFHKSKLFAQPLIYFHNYCNIWNYSKYVKNFLLYFWFSQWIKNYANLFDIYFHAKRNYSNYLIKHCNLKLLLSECEKFSIIFFDFHNSRYIIAKRQKLCKFICSMLVISMTAKFSLVQKCTIPAKL